MRGREREGHSLSHPLLRIRRAQGELERQPNSVLILFWCGVLSRQ